MLLRAFGNFCLIFDSVSSILNWSLEMFASELISLTKGVYLRQKLKSLKGRKNFLELFKAEPVYEDYFLKIILGGSSNNALQNGLKLVQLGIVCRKKATPKSFIRNRVRRVLREIMRKIIGTVNVNFSKILIVVKHTPKQRMYNVYSEILWRVIQSHEL